MSRGMVGIGAVVDSIEDDESGDVVSGSEVGGCSDVIHNLDGRGTFLVSC